jgi:predicted alpha/beta-fold hydrolase
MIIEVAEQIRDQNALQVDVEDINLLGVSMSGSAVVHALYEDQRLNKKLFRSGVIFSAAYNLMDIPGKQMRNFIDKDQYNPWKDLTPLSSGKLSNFGVKKLFNQYRKISLLKDSSRPFVPRNNELGQMFYRSYIKRIEFLKKNPGENWNPAISLDSFEDYLRTSNLLTLNLDLKTHLVAVHSKNDPAVPFSQFDRFNKMYAENPNVETHAIKYGGHFGYTVTYGRDWIAALVKYARDGGTVP